MPPLSPATAQAAIRASLVLGVVLFGVVTWSLHRAPGYTPDDPNIGERLRPMVLALWAASIAAILLIRQRWGRARNDGERNTLAIIGLAVAEGLALFGAVIYFRSDDPRLYMAGLFLMLGTLMVFPLRART